VLPATRDRGLLSQAPPAALAFLLSVFIGIFSGIPNPCLKFGEAAKNAHDKTGVAIPLHPSRNIGQTDGKCVKMSPLIDLPPHPFRGSGAFFAKKITT
jgi:hypothetical protein